MIKRNDRVHSAIEKIAKKVDHLKADANLMFANEVAPPRAIRWWKNKTRAAKINRNIKELPKPKKKSKKRIIGGQAAAGGILGGVTGIGARAITYIPESIDVRYDPKAGRFGGLSSVKTPARHVLPKMTAPVAAVLGALLLGAEGASKGGQKRHARLHNEELKRWERTRDPKYRKALAKLIHKKF